MRLIAWDTSSKTGAIAALEWEPARDAKPRLVAEWSLSVEAAHSDRLLWAIHQVLEAARWTLEDIDVYGVGVGPGSFTGVRIGVTTARTLSLATGKPLIGVSSLAALARPYAQAYAGAPASAGKVLLIAATDACKGELFVLKGHARAILDCVAHADASNGELWKRGVEEDLFKPPQLVAALKKKLADRSTQGWLVIGEARDRYPEIWAELPTKDGGWRDLAPALPYGDTVQGRSVALLAWEGFQAGLGRPGIEVHPRYLRAADAEIKLKAGLLGVKGANRG